MPEDTKQEVFEHCYRGRQASLHHVAYMRIAKVWIALQSLRDIGAGLENKDIFDYGFGAGTFFRYCPRNAALYGVEQDSLNIGAVRAMLENLGHRQVDLDTIDIAHWERHRLLNRQYDIILCSHVMEHLLDPKAFLARISQCLKPTGIFLGIVPINERVMNPHHVAKVTHAQIESWAAQPRMELFYYRESDPLMYWIQPLFNYNSGSLHKIARVLSFGIGVAAKIFGFRMWNILGNACSPLFHLKPTQAVFAIHWKADDLST